MTIALTLAGMGPEDIDYVNAHGSSTALNDSTETRAIHAALGQRAHEIPVSGTKPYYGHALGASGAIEVGISAMILENGWVPPTLNHDSPGEECDLDYVPDPSGRDVEARALLTNSFGFGGINAALVLAAHTPS
jgi:3-oxoacyl-[acyl-carrier-protein] synthase II